MPKMYDLIDLFIEEAKMHKQRTGKDLILVYGSGGRLDFRLKLK